MESAGLIAERREMLRDVARGRVKPAHQVWLAAPLSPLLALTDRLNREGRLLPGLRAEVRHLVLRAAARALGRHPWLNDFLLISGEVQRNPQVAVRVTLEAEGRPASCVVPDPSSRPLEEVVAEIAAREVEERVSAVRRAIKLARFRRSRPVISWVISRGLLDSLLWLRDRAPALERRMQRNVRRCGTFGFLDVGRHDATGAAFVLLACHSASLLVGAPRLADGAPRLPIGLVYDARLFEAYEAVDFLGEVIELLAEPEARLA